MALKLAEKNKSKAPALLELQQQFSRYLLQPENTEIYSVIKEKGLSSQRRLQIYRHNIANKILETLRAVYPNIVRIVGDAFFARLAQDYLQNHPSTFTNLTHFGGNFSAFLLTNPACRTLPYLPEIASLEWAIHEVFYEADPTPFDYHCLQRVPEEKYQDIKFILHSGSRLLNCHYPIWAIWQRCQQENGIEQQINLTEKGDKLLILRRGLEVGIERLTPGEFALLSAFSKGATFQEAYNFAHQASNELDINHCLQKHLRLNTIVSFSL